MTPSFEFILETPPLPPPGRPVKRRLAVRAVILRGGRVLMVHSRAVGDWKFPGGGVEALETPEQALGREVAEETGYGTKGPPRFLGRVLERSPGRDNPQTLFEMESRYFLTTVAGDPAGLDLDDYERDLGFEAHWADLSEVIKANRRLAASGRGDLPPWLTRETRVLEWLLTNAPPLSAAENLDGSQKPR